MASEHRIVTFNITERWFKKAQQREVAVVERQFDALSAQGWPLVTMAQTPTFGSVTQRQAGTMMVATFVKDVTDALA